MSKPPLFPPLTPADRSQLKRAARRAFDQPSASFVLFVHSDPQVDWDLENRRAAEFVGPRLPLIPMEVGRLDCGFRFVQDPPKP
jgi:hypothetical protein